jgi:hypothetical protein
MQHLKEAARHLERAAYELGSDKEHGGLTAIIITNICTMVLNIHARIRL